MYKKILVCLDGDQHSEAILPFIKSLAERFHSKVLLLNVISLPQLLPSGGWNELEEKCSGDFTLLEAEAAIYLEKIAEACQTEGIDVDCVLVEGNIEESVLAGVRTWGIDLIALAVHDRKALSRFFAKHTADCIIRKSGVPVLIFCPDHVSV
jgi:nucleotide-binding universal stress UspA family protein